MIWRKLAVLFLMRVQPKSGRKIPPKIHGVWTLGTLAFGISALLILIHGGAHIYVFNGPHIYVFNGPWMSTYRVFFYWYPP